MLSPIEKILFAFLALVCIVATINTFGQMVKIIMRGEGKLKWDELPRRMITGLVALFSQGRIIRHRKLSSLFHYGVAWGFIFYFLVNAIDVAEGLITGFEFLPNNIIGDIYRLAADIFGTLVLVGVLYFILRRFAWGDQVLKIRDNVKVLPKVREGGVNRDSFAVALFILFHVGFRMMGAAFNIAQHGADPFQPVANLIAQTFMVGGNPAALNFGWHFSWWMAVGLVLMF
ncbi:MAG: hypothetical protein KC434_16170, partial [Anaerolineales bacterium]|nr:hypothetical protein [Anaerolineales bacterium]